MGTDWKSGGSASHIYRMQVEWIGIVIFYSRVYIGWPFALFHFFTRETDPYHSYDLLPHTRLFQGLCHSILFFSFPSVYRKESL